MAASSCCSRASTPAAATNGGIAWRPFWRRVSMLVSAQNVCESFGSFLAVRGADLAVAEGEIIGLIGPNGAGKSTFFNCLAGDTVPTTGRVLFDGVDVTRASAEVHARAGIRRTVQVPPPFADMTALGNVMVGAFLRHRHRGTARESALRVIEMTGLARQSAQRARSLGTPGRKRLEIARVLATGPRLMLLDEALAGLTPTELQQAITLVRRIHELGVTLVIVEHVMEVIMTLAQRVLVFNQGHVIAHGKPHEIVADEAVIEAYLGRGHRRRGEAPGTSCGSRISRCNTAISSASPTSRYEWRKAPSSRCSARTAQARPRRSTPLRAWSRRAADRSNGAARRSRGSPLTSSLPRDLRFRPRGGGCWFHRRWSKVFASAPPSSPTRRALRPCSSGSTRCFPGWPSGAINSPAPFRAANDKCWRSAAR